MLRALSHAARARALRAGAGLRAADARRAARHQPVAPAHDLPPRGRASPTCAQRAALSIYSTLLGGSMGSRLFDEIREKRGLCYSVYAIDHAFADVPILQLGSGLESAKCVEAYTRMREIVDELRDAGADRGGGAARTRLRRRAPGAGLREHRRRRALRGRTQRSCSARTIDPDEAIAALDAVTYERGPRSRRWRRRQSGDRLRRPAHGRRILSRLSR